MKKYLIKGLLALIVGGFVASCADDKVEYIPIEQQKASAYAEAFKELIGGEVSPNHDWGFKKTSIIEQPSEARAMTRDVNVNGNMWDTRPELGATEEADVLRYMDMTLAQMDAANHNYSKNFPVNMPNFFVTQVHTGDDYYASAQDAEQAKTDPSKKNVLGSYHMNELVIAVTQSAARTNNTIASNTLPDADNWYHANNFNAGSNHDWGGNTKFTNMGTCDFAYHNSKDSRYHNRWIVVNGADIDATKYSGYYYVCFDFQSQVPDGQTDKTYFSFSGYNDSNVMQSGYNGEIEGFYQTVQDIIDAGITEIRGYDGKTRNISDIQDFTVTRWEHAHAIIPGDTNYSDWIIRLCAATPDGGGGSSTTGGGTSSSTTATRTDRVERRRIVDQGRIFCEDLGTNEITTSDIDFNDAVFDAKIWKVGQFDVYFTNGVKTGESDWLTGTYDNGIDDDGTQNGKYRYIAEIRLLAAGGTVPLKIGGNNGFEIHSKFGEGNGRTIGHTTIINTMGAPSQANFTTTVNTETCDAVTAEVDITSLVAGQTEIGLDIIPIEVQWVGQAGQTVGELNANYGEAPQKLCVPIGTPWVYERIPIAVSEEREGAYADFGVYARNRTPLFWEGTKNESLLYPSNPEGMTAEAVCENTFTGNSYHDKTITTGTTTTTTTDILVLAEETHEFPGESTQGVVVNIFNKDLHAGDVIRVTGSNTGSDPHSLEVALIPSDSESWSTRLYNTTVDFSNGSITFTVTQDIVDALPASKQAFGIWGRNITVTKIERIRTTESTSN